MKGLSKSVRGRNIFKGEGFWKLIVISLLIFIAAGKVKNVAVRERGENISITATTVYPPILYYASDTDPTAAGGVSAPVGQLLFRTDVPSIYYKSGTANTAWTALGRSAAVLTPTTCGAGQAVTAISSAGVGTCTAVASLVSAQWIFGNGADGTLTFDGVTTPLAGATLSGSTYTMTRDIFCHNCTVNNGVNITGQYRFYDDGTLTLNGIIHSNGNNAVGNTAGTALTAGSLPASENGGAGGSSAGGAAGGGIGTGSTAPRDCTAATAGPAANGSTCGGAGGGAGASGVGASGGAVALMAATQGDIRSWWQAPLGRQANSSVSQTASGGGGGRGDAGNVKTGGGGGGAAGYRYLALHAVTGSGSIQAKGGNGGDGQAGGNTGSGGGGGGGYIQVAIGSGSCPTMTVTGGSPGTPQGTGTSGGTGGNGLTHCFGP